jgi:hypothetical protein
MPISAKSRTSSTEAPPAANPGSHARAEGIQDREAGPRIKLIFRRAKQKYGHVPLPTRLRARDPKLLELSEQMSRYTVAPGTVAPVLKELVQLKVATLVGCGF